MERAVAVTGIRRGQQHHVTPLADQPYQPWRTAEQAAQLPG